MSNRDRSPLFPMLALVAVSVVTACSGGEQGVIQAQPDDPVIVLSEGACPTTCPVYDMTLHGDGSYVLNGVRFVKTTGVTTGQLGPEAWSGAQSALEDAGFWAMKPKQTPETLGICHPDAPTVQVTWRTETGKEKTVVYDAGCGVDKTQKMIVALRAALNFERLVWSDQRFDYSN
ncbi:MAG: DUF6438 domain-containing protein [Hyphomonadaceae bacterium]